jgi:hypothetical protein
MGSSIAIEVMLGLHPNALGVGHAPQRGLGLIYIPELTMFGSILRGWIFLFFLKGIDIFPELNILLKVFSRPHTRSSTFILL